MAISDKKAKEDKAVRSKTALYTEAARRVATAGKKEDDAPKSQKMGKVDVKDKKNPVQDSMLQKAKTRVTTGTSATKVFGKKEPKSAVTDVRKSDNGKRPYDWAKDDKDLKK